MSLFATGNQVKINPSVIEDLSLQRSHHFFKEVLRYNITGTVVEIDTQRSTPEVCWYRVQFPYFTVPIPEQYILMAPIT